MSTDFIPENIVASTRPALVKFTPTDWKQSAEALGRENADLRRQVDDCWQQLGAIYDEAHTAGLELGDPVTRTHFADLRALREKQAQAMRDRAQHVADNLVVTGGRKPKTVLMEWLHDQQCGGFNLPQPYCTGASRAAHARLRSGTATRIMDAGTIDEAARIVHDTLCPYVAQASNGIFFEGVLTIRCGIGGADHIAAMVKHPTMLRVWELAGNGDESPQGQVSAALFDLAELGGGA